MAVTLNETPSGNRLHIGIFGKTNSGKSSFINTFSGLNAGDIATTVIGFFMNNLLVVTSLAFVCLLICKQKIHAKDFC